MLDSRNFWYAQMLVLIVLYVAAIVVAAQGSAMHWMVRLSVIILAAHVIEVPLAFYRLKGKNPQPLRLIPLTLLFGLIWWFPARRGVFPVR